MARFASFFLTLLTALCVLVAFQRPAYGYVDPGSGFVALQTFASVMAAGGYFLRRRIRSLFGSRQVADQTPEPSGIEDDKTARTARAWRR